MKILTFGSCLSRYTANAYIRMFGGAIISSVYHNRSDQFIGKFIEKSWANIPFAATKLITGEDNASTDKDSKVKLVFKNQQKRWIGQHFLPGGTPLFEGLDDEAYDLIILDNYMDVSARLLQHASAIPGGLFMKVRSDIEIPKDFIFGSFLDPLLAAEMMSQIISFLHQKCPKAKIVFLNFPWNTYEDNPERIIRASKYQDVFRSDLATVIPALTIPSSFQTKDRQHFKLAQYCAYAGILYREVLGQPQKSQQI